MCPTDVWSDIIERVGIDVLCVIAVFVCVLKACTKRQCSVGPEERPGGGGGGDREQPRKETTRFGAMSARRPYSMIYDEQRCFKNSK